MRYINTQLRNYSENFLSICFRTMKRKLHNQVSNFIGTKDSLEDNELEDSSRHPDLLIFDLSCIIAATNNFSLTNKLGQGGFGSVFKVQLQFIMTLFTSSPFFRGCEWRKMSSIS